MCFAGQKVGKLPSPLNYIRSQAIGCSDDENFQQHINKFLEIIAKEIGVTVPITDIKKTDLYKSIKLIKPIKTSKKNAEVLSIEEYDPTNPDLKRVIKYIGRTIFIPIKKKILKERDFFERGYNIESYFLRQQYQNRGDHYNIDSTPSELLKGLYYDPDPILQKYYDETKKYCDEYDTFSKRLEIINQSIFEKRNRFWEDFTQLCNNLNNPQNINLNDSDYSILLSYAISGIQSLNKTSYVMAEFHNTNKDELRAYILKSPLKKDVRDYSALRTDYSIYCDHSIPVIDNLLKEWLRTYLLIETDFEPEPIIRMK